MKKVIAIVLVMGLIFGVTYITQFTGSDVTPDGKSSTLPLLFGHDEAKRDPTSDDPHFRYFHGFYEQGAENGVYFWFQNAEPVEVSFGFRGVSCSSCTSIRAAVVPQAAIDEFVSLSVLPVLPIGFGGVPTLLPTVAAVDLLPKLAWTDFGVDKYDVVMKVPPAAGKDRPTWGVVRFGYKATQLGPWDPKAAFYAQAAGAAAAHEYMLSVHFIGVDGFEVTPREVDVAELAEGAPPAKVNLYYWSVIRPLADLPPPAVSVMNGDPFVVVEKPVPLTDEELDRLAAQIGSQRQEMALKLKSGYRIPVSVLREAPGKLPDIGAFEKVVHVAGLGTRVHGIRLKGQVTGLVWLQDVKKVDLKSYNGKLGTEATATLVTGRPDLDLELLPGETSPKFLKVALAELKSEPGRKSWALTLTIPPEEGRDPHWEGWVVLTTKGPNPQKIRVPVMGHGHGK